MYRRSPNLITGKGTVLSRTIRQNVGLLTRKRSATSYPVKYFSSVFMQPFKHTVGAGRNM